MEQTFDRCSRAHTHKDGRMDYPVVGDEFTGSSLRCGVFMLQSKIQTLHTGYKDSARGAQSQIYLEKKETEWGNVNKFTAPFDLLFLNEV